MIVRARRGNIVGGFLREDLGKVHVLHWERDLWLCLFSGNGELSCHGKFCNKGGVGEEAFAIASENLIDLVIV